MRYAYPYDMEPQPDCGWMVTFPDVPEAIARVLFLDGDTIRTTFRDFSAAMLTFLCKDGPGNWSTFCEEVTDNFRVINPTRYRIVV